MRRTPPFPPPLAPAQAANLLWANKAAATAQLTALGLKVEYAYTTNREDVANLEDRGKFVTLSEGAVAGVSADGASLDAQLKALINGDAAAADVELPRNTVVTLLIKGTAPVDPYTNDVAGWQQELADNSSRVEGEGTLVTFTYNADDLMRLYYNSNTGNLVLPSTLWENGYLAEVRVDMKHFHKSVGRNAADTKNNTATVTDANGLTTVVDNHATGEAIDAVIEVLGRTDAVSTVQLTSEFNTNYDGVYGTNSWDYQKNHLVGSYDPLRNGMSAADGKFLRDGASLISQIEPVKPQIQNFTYVGATGAADTSVELTGKKNPVLSDSDPEPDRAH